MESIKIYAGTYNKYANGDISGDWIDLEDYNDFEELMEALKELHSDEEDPELMYQDIEAPKLFHDMINESFISSEIYEFIEAIEACSYDIEVLEAYASNYGDWPSNLNDLESLINKVEEAYMGEYENDEIFAEETAEQCGYEINNTWPHNCIDWSHAARELMYDYFEDNGHYFRNL